MGSDVSALGLLIDIPLGILMWAAILRFVLTVFMKEDSRFVLMRMTTSMTAPLIKVVAYLAPSWIIDRIMPLFVAFVLFVIRYYVMPLILGYDVEAFSALPVEHLLLSVQDDLGL